MPLPFYRFPYGETTPQAIADVNALGFADIEFTADTNGYLGAAGGMTVDRAVERVLKALTPGAIVQMHVGAGAEGGPGLDAQALPRIIEAVQARGYRVTDLRTVVTRSGAAGAVPGGDGPTLRPGGSTRRLDPGVGVGDGRSRDILISRRCRRCRREAEHR
ncbi:hypothetical protein GCM10010193_52560 [Kitasatospora atroaurantiaca]|uniref:hypothetical protein n=1 Tax=Kitasatospora atroaurantiaca TaxID=285545 RepID=UPI00319DDD25